MRLFLHRLLEIRFASARCFAWRSSAVPDRLNTFTLLTTRDRLSRRLLLNNFGRGSARALLNHPCEHKRAKARVVSVDPDSPRHCGVALDEPRNIWGVPLQPDDWDDTAVSYDATH